MTCPTCGWPLATAADVANGLARWESTQGGHQARHGESE